MDSSYPIRCVGADVSIYCCKSSCDRRPYRRLGRRFPGSCFPVLLIALALGYGMMRGWICPRLGRVSTGWRGPTDHGDDVHLALFQHRNFAVGVVQKDRSAANGSDRVCFSGRTVSGAILIVGRACPVRYTRGNWQSAERFLTPATGLGLALAFCLVLPLWGIAALRLS